DHLVETLFPSKRYGAPVWRPARRAVIKAVVGQAHRLAINRGDPKVGPFVAVFVALMRVGCEYQRTAIGTPGRATDIHAEMRELSWLPARSRHNIKFLRRRRRRIARIRQIAPLVKAVIHPVINPAFEALVDLALKIR